MRMKDVAEFAAAWGEKYNDHAEVHILVPDGPGPEDIEKALNEIRSMGYFAYVRYVNNNEEIVVSDKVIDEYARSSRRPTPRSGSDSGELHTAE